MKKIELEIVALSHSITQTHSYAVVLGEVNGLRRLPIVIGGFEAQAIAVALERMNPSRPLTHDLMKNFMMAFNVELHEVVINDLQEGIFYSKLVCSSDADTIEIDSRTSDALALAVRFGCSIFTYENILESAGILMEDDDKKKKSSTSSAPVTTDGPDKEDLKKLSLEELTSLLTEVLEHEDYIRAIAIRDEFKNPEEIIIMIIFPNGKINIGLNILGKREDGFHNLATVFYPIPLSDSLEIIENKNAYAPVQFTNSGTLAEEKEENNSCVKAYHLLKKDFPQLPAVNIHLHKSIPMGAGLGGGSADASFLLKALNQQFNLGIASNQLSEYALQLGSDCPFFILNRPCLAKGRGEIIEKLLLDLSGYKIILVNPRIHVNTAWAFTQLNGKFNDTHIEKNISSPIETWKDALFNDFEKPVFEKYPAIKQIKDSLYEQGAIYASMSGSGSSVYGIFKAGDILASTGFPSNYLQLNLTL